MIRRIVSGKDIRIQSVCTQEVLKNLRGRSAALDVHAYHFHYKEWRDEREQDALFGGEIYYYWSRKVLFDDGSHILYVNRKYRGDDEIGGLINEAVKK